MFWRPYLTVMLPKVIFWSMFYLKEYNRGRADSRLCLQWPELVPVQGLPVVVVPTWRAWHWSGELLLSTLVPVSSGVWTRAGQDVNNANVGHNIRQHDRIWKYRNLGYCGHCWVLLGSFSGKFTCYVKPSDFFPLRFFVHCIGPLKVGLISSWRSKRDSVDGYFLASRSMNWIPVSNHIF